MSSGYRYPNGMTARKILKALDRGSAYNISYLCIDNNCIHFNRLLLRKYSVRVCILLHLNDPFNGRKQNTCTTTNYTTTTLLLYSLKVQISCFF